jgi:hypothetical protein
MRSIPATAGCFALGLVILQWLAPAEAQIEEKPEELTEETIEAEYQPPLLDYQPPLLDPMADEPLADRGPIKQRDYTAQHRPRVTVMPFEDTNTEAADQGFGRAVSAMLVTYLKRRSQLVVVERHRLGGLLREQERAAQGITTETKEYAAAAQTLRDWTPSSTAT